MDQLTDTLAALADPTRRSILDRLTTGAASVGDLAQPFRMTQQAVSKHLACLERARLIEKRRVGRRNVCALRPEPLREVAAWMARYRELWEQSLDRLEDYLARLQTDPNPTDPTRS
ncbi:MAG: ArsR/SmtB family transcription factor [Planctomycetota bacterium]